jgi:hypothetical protein
MKFSAFVRTGESRGVSYQQLFMRPLLIFSYVFPTNIVVNVPGVDDVR